MSIFPKRTVRNSTVTIHWNFNTAGLRGQHIYPYVRIGVQAPDGQVTMLLQQHLLAFPPVQLKPQETGPVAQKSLYLNKNTPLLILADYLSGTHQKEVLANILQHIQDGKHYYFTYQVPADAPLGKYTLISELYNEGQVKYSKTAADDFFWVEALTINEATYSNGKGTAVIQNQAPEKTPVRLVEYNRHTHLQPASVTAFELQPFETKTVHFSSPCTWLLYNEERIHLPLWPDNEPAVLRNQQLISVVKETGNEPAVYLLEREGDNGITLTGTSKQLWEQADGLMPRSHFLHIDKEAYAALLHAGLLHEIHV